MLLMTLLQKKTPLFTEKNILGLDPRHFCTILKNTQSTRQSTKINKRKTSQAEMIQDFF